MPSIHGRFSKALPVTTKYADVVRVQHVDALDALTDGENDETELHNGDSRPWRPATLRTGFLAGIALITVGLILSITYLLVTSEREQGIMFAKNINDLPLSRSFAYLYLPTLLSVMYSFFWTWIDLDIKRLEPYFQLSKAQGTSGRSSLLLSYPLEFLLMLPFLAFKHRHWAVLSAAVTMILVSWGLTPIQAGMFATRTITITEQVPSVQASAYRPIAQQVNLSATYAQSVYNIAWLNETLLPYMTEEYILRAFGPSSMEEIESSNMTYRSATTMYSVDVQCAGVILWDGPKGRTYNSSDGCSFYAPPIRPYGGSDTSKPYDTIYVGYQNENGAADYYLSSDCNETFAHSFFIRWSWSTASAIKSDNLSNTIDPALSNTTALFCKPTYYEQEVEATISIPGAKVVSTSRKGGKNPLPGDMFNSTTFEWLMSAGSDVSVRGSYPTTTLPNQKTHLMNTSLNLEYIPKMAPFAIALTQQPMHAYLDPETLRLSYQAAYRLLFARQLADILGKQLDSPSAQRGARSYVTQAVVVVPAYAYAAAAILGFVLLVTVVLANEFPKRRNLLHEDPGTLGAQMDLVAPDTAITAHFASLSGGSFQTLEESIHESSFVLENSCDSRPVLRSREGVPESGITRRAELTLKSNVDGAYVKGHRPFEMKIAIGWMFFVLQIAAITTFAVLFIKAQREQGLSLPSQSTFVRQLLENYIPISLATFIEPFWLILNRLLCLLQPFEELRRGGIHAQRSIDLDYSSLPPQFLFWRAARAKHWMVFLLCFMVLSANALSVALSGLMYEGEKGIAKDVDLKAIRSSKFRKLDGLGLPFNTDLEGNWQGGTTSDQFYRLMSNLTANTPLPPWVDDNYAYAAIDLSGIHATSTIKTRTVGFGASLECRSPDTDQGEFADLEFNASSSNATLNVTLRNDTDSKVRCEDNRSSAVVSYRSLDSLRDVQAGHLAFELATMLTSNSSSAEDLFCRQHLLAGWIRADLIQDDEKLQLGLPVMDITSRQDTVLICRPTIHVVSAELEIDATGRVLRRLSQESTANESWSYADLIAQVHQFLPDMGATWHTDSYPSDFLNYLIVQSTGDNTLLQASLPVPSVSHASQQLSTLYRKLFAILVGTNQNLLFEPDTTNAPYSAQVITPQTRILFSTPAFVVVEAIFACYIITTLIFYSRRPWKILPRLPASIASNLAFFAASRALQDLADAEHCTADHARSARAAWTWSYGSFIGIDGKPHVGIERDPFVALLRSEKLTSPPVYSP